MPTKTHVHSRRRRRQRGLPQQPPGTSPRVRALLEADRYRVGRADLIELRGEIDAGSASVLRRELEHAVVRRDRPLIVDLSEVGFIDSSGLSLLLNAQRRLTRGGRAFATVAPSGPVARALELTRLSETLSRRSDRASALTAVAA